MLINPNGLVWIGRRADKPNDEGGGQWWQMPQGGIDKGESPGQAALRELHEETAVTSAQVIAEAPGWYNYDLPDHLIGKSWGGKYRGQTQQWFLVRFKGEDSDIDIATKHPEFKSWRWMDADLLVELIVPFKRPVYRDVVAEFRHLL